jgi:hypothetical protein
MKVIGQTPLSCIKIKHTLGIFALALLPLGNSMAATHAVTTAIGNFETYQRYTTETGRKKAHRGRHRRQHNRGLKKPTL